MAMDMSTLDVSFSRIIGMALHPLIFEGDREVIVNGAKETDNIGLSLSIFESAVYCIAMLDNSHVITVSEQLPGRVRSGGGCGCFMRSREQQRAPRSAELLISAQVHVSS
jgi:hypothetical protein